MTARILPGRFTLLAALGATSLALVAAAPADAIYRSYETTVDDAPITTRTVENTNETPPVDENGKKGCAYRKFDGGTGYYPHGTVITVTLPDGSSKSMKCVDGEWEAAFTQPGDYSFWVDHAFVSADSMLVLEP